MFVFQNKITKNIQQMICVYRGWMTNHWSEGQVNVWECTVLYLTAMW